MNIQESLSTEIYSQVGHWKCVPEVNENQMRYFLQKCLVEYVCWFSDTFSCTLQKLRDRMQAAPVQKKFRHGFILNWFVSRKNSCHIKNWLWNTRQKWKVNRSKPHHPVHFYSLLFTYKLTARVNKVWSALCFKPQVAKQKLTHHMSHQCGESVCLSVEKNHRNTNRNYRENACFTCKKHGKKGHRGPK